MRALVQPGRVHKRLYTDPDIFELELERIFGSAWIYVGHESQVKSPGDFLATRIGRKPLLLVRDGEGKLRLLHNQCAHRGRWSSHPSRATRRSFVAAITAGRITSMAGSRRHPCCTDIPRISIRRTPSLAWLRVPRVASYRGFVFGSLTSDGPSLEDYLGYMRTSFDDMVDRAPDGALEVAGGVFKHTYRGNWKLYLENLCDAAHPLFTHQSSIDAAQQQSDAVHSDGSGEIAIRQMRQNGAPYSFWEANVGIWTYPNGHSFLGDYHDDAKLVAALNDPAFRDYIAAMEAKKGKEANKEDTRGAALEQQRLSEPVFHEPISATARGASDFRERNRCSYVLLPPAGSAGAHVREYHQLRQCREWYRLARPHR